MFKCKLLYPSWLNLYIHLFFFWWSFSDKVSKCLTALKMSLKFRCERVYILDSVNMLIYILVSVQRCLCKYNCNHLSGTQHKWPKSPWSNIKMNITLFKVEGMTYRACQFFARWICTFVWLDWWTLTLATEYVVFLLPFDEPINYV